MKKGLLGLFVVFLLVACACGIVWAEADEEKGYRISQDPQALAFLGDYVGEIPPPEAGVVFESNKAGRLIEVTFSDVDDNGKVTLGKFYLGICRGCPPDRGSKDPKNMRCYLEKSPQGQLRVVLEGRQKMFMTLDSKGNLTVVSDSPLFQPFTLQRRK